MANSKLPSLRFKSYLAQQRRCYYCGVLMWLGRPDGFQASSPVPKGVLVKVQCTAEHLVAKRDGGADHKQNIVAACRHCNFLRHARKKALSPEAYRELVRKRISLGRWHDSSVFQLGLIAATESRPNLLVQLS